MNSVKGLAEIKARAVNEQCKEHLQMAREWGEIVNKPSYTAVR